MIFQMTGNGGAFKNNNFTYTGTCSIDRYTDFCILQLKNSGTLTFKRTRPFEAFLVGGGGSGGGTTVAGGGGGGGCLTVLTNRGYAVFNENQSYSITVGGTQTAIATAGNSTTLYFSHTGGSTQSITAAGGQAGAGTGNGSSRKGGDGSSSGGGGAYGSGRKGGNGGSNLTAGAKGAYTSGNSSKAGPGGSIVLPNFYYATSSGILAASVSATTGLGAYAFCLAYDPYGYGLFGGGGGGASAEDVSENATGGDGGGGRGGGAGNSHPLDGTNYKGGGGGGHNPGVSQDTDSYGWGGSGVILLKIPGQIYKG